MKKVILLSSVVLAFATTSCEPVSIQEVRIDWAMWNSPPAFDEGVSEAYIQLSGTMPNRAGNDDSLVPIQDSLFNVCDCDSVTIERVLF